MSTRKPQANKARIGIIVQARMGSTRLPGKVLKDIEGRSVLWHVVDRLRRAALLDQIVIATTTDPKDDLIETFCRREKIDCFRGNEEDVLDRYYQAATQFQVDQIVRITSDCPLIDPEIVDAVILKHLDTRADYSSNTLQRTFPRGMDTEVFTYAAMVRAMKEATGPAEREHVTPYFYQHPELFRLTSMEAQGAQRRPEIRLCVDTPEDLELIRTVYRELKPLPRIRLTDILKLFDSKPELLKINAMIQQKALKS